MHKGFRMIGIGLAGLVAMIALGGCDRDWGCRRHMPEHFLKRIDREVKELKLTPSQQTKYADIRTRLEADMRTHMDGMKQLHSEIEKGLAAERPDMNAMAAQLKKRFAEEGDPRQRLTDYFVEFYSILDEHQQKLVRDHLLQRLACFNRHL